MKGSKPITRSINCGFRWWSFSYLSFILCVSFHIFTPHVVIGFFVVVVASEGPLCCDLIINTSTAVSLRTTGYCLILSHNHLFYHLYYQSYRLYYSTNQPQPLPSLVGIIMISLSIHEFIIFHFSSKLNYFVFLCEPNSKGDINVTWIGTGTLFFYIFLFIYSGCCCCWFFLCTTDCDLYIFIIIIKFSNHVIMLYDF